MIRLNEIRQRVHGCEDGAPFIALGNAHAELLLERDGELQRVQRVEPESRTEDRSRILDRRGVDLVDLAIRAGDQVPDHPDRRDGDAPGGEVDLDDDHVVGRQLGVRGKQRWMGHDERPDRARAGHGDPLTRGGLTERAHRPRREAQPTATSASLHQNCFTVS